MVHFVVHVRSTRDHLPPGSVGFDMFSAPRRVEQGIRRKGWRTEPRLASSAMTEWMASQAETTRRMHASSWLQYGRLDE